MEQIVPTTISTTTSSLSLTTLNYGLTTHSLQLPALGRDILIGYRSPQEYHYESEGGRGFRNQVVGRYANRLPSGRTDLKEGGVLNLAGDEGVCLHGGSRGLDTQLWTQIPRSSSHLFPPNDASYPSSSSETLYSYLSPSGTDGFPLTLLIEGLAFLSDPESATATAGGKVTVVLRAQIVDDGTSTKVELEKGTPVNLTLHWGFNLGDFGKGGDESVREHKMWIDSSRVTELAPKTALATGRTTPLAPDSPLYFHQGTPSNPSTHRTIGSNFPSGIDNNLIFDSPITKSSPRVVLTAPDEKISLRFKTNQSSVQCYTANHFDGSFSKKAEHGSDSRGYKQYGGVFLEFQHPLATFLHKDLQEVAEGTTILKHGEVYENWVECEVLVK